MADVCDHKCVGMLVWQDEKLLLIERKKPPFGFAPPAGHLDGDVSFEDAARRELKEEVGLQTENLRLLIEGRKENACRRTDGSWHYWKIYSVEASGKVMRNMDETKQSGFYTKEALRALAGRTEQYLRGNINEQEWQASPGIEPVWYEWFKQGKIL